MSGWNVTLAGIAGVMLAMSLPVASTVGRGNNEAPDTLDPQIVAAVSEVSAARIEETVRKLAGFDTRHTLSAQMPASSGKGVMAAAEWIKAQFQQYSRDCGGCLEVKTDEFVQQPAARVPQLMQRPSLSSAPSAAISANERS